MVPDDIQEQQLDHMIALYEQDLLRMSYIYLRDPVLAEDAVQETFVKAFRSLDGFRGDSNEKTWLMRIAMNTCKDMRRTGWFRFVDRNVCLENLPEASCDFTAVDDTLITEIMRLPRKQMEVVLLYYYQEMTAQEIAKALGITVPSVSGRLKRAREQLKKALEGGRADG